MNLPVNSLSEIYTNILTLINKIYVLTNKLTFCDNRAQKVLICAIFILPLLFANVKMLKNHCNKFYLEKT